jgi:hypothetical protein
MANRCRLRFLLIGAVGSIVGIDFRLLQAICALRTRIQIGPELRFLSLFPSIERSVRGVPQVGCRREQQHIQQ